MEAILEVLDYTLTFKFGLLEGVGAGKRENYRGAAEGRIVTGRHGETALQYKISEQGAGNR